MISISMSFHNLQYQITEQIIKILQKISVKCLRYVQKASGSTEITNMVDKMCSSPVSIYPFENLEVINLKYSSQDPL